MGRLDCVCEALGKMFDEHAVNGKLTREQLKQLFEKESDMKAKMESGCCEKMKEWMDKNCKDPMDFNDFCSCVCMVASNKYSKDREGGSCEQACK